MKKVFLILVLLSIALAGCDGEEAPSSTTPFLPGTTGLLMNLMEDSPPSEVYDGGSSQFQVAVKLRNEGEWNVLAGEAIVKISGIDPVEFGKQPSEMIQKVDEDLIRTYKDAEGNIIEGTQTVVEFDDFNYAGSIPGNMQFPIRADVCYTYGTKAISKLCVKEDLYDTSEGGLCVVSAEKEVFSSKAPIKITSMKESVRGKEKIGFTFKIEHMGNGGIFQKGSECNTEGIAFEDKIWVEVNTKMEGLKCNGLQDGTDSSGYITMYGAERSITCTQPVDVLTDYEKAIDITLIYDYKEDRTKQLLLKHTVIG